MMCFLRCVAIKIAVFHGYKNIHMTRLISVAVSLPMKITIASQTDKAVNLFCYILGEAAEN